MPEVDKRSAGGGDEEMPQYKPFLKGEKEIALEAAVSAGLVRPSDAIGSITRFDLFWMKYQGSLAAYRLKKCDYLVEVLQEEREERAKDCAKYRRKYLGIAVSLIFGAFFGAVVTELILHL